MTDIAAFDEFATDNGIAGHNERLIRVYLEGKTDQTLFQDYWFTDQFSDRIRVLLPLGGEGGCTAISGAIDKSRNDDGIPAFGIVDRDTLLRRKDWQWLYEPDDEKFRRGNPVGNPCIVVSLFWEIEAYLLEPPLLYDWIRNNHRGCPDAPCAPTALISDLLEHAICVLEKGPVAAIHQALKVRFPEKWCVENSLEEIRRERQTFFLKVRTRPDWRESEHQPVIEIVPQLVDAIRSAALAKEADDAFWWLLRFVDTKRLLARLCHRYGLKDTAHWNLAGTMNQSRKYPLEFQAFLERVISAVDAEYGA
jgi:hypothetical protein